MSEIRTFRTYLERIDSIIQDSVDTGRSLSDTESIIDSVLNELRVYGWDRSSVMDQVQKIYWTKYQEALASEHANISSHNVPTTQEDGEVEQAIVSVPNILR